MEAEEENLSEEKRLSLGQEVLSHSMFFFLWETFAMPALKGLWWRCFIVSLFIVSLEVFSLQLVVEMMLMIDDRS